MNLGPMVGTMAELMERVTALEPHRTAAEVRYVAGLETHAHRTVYISGVWDERGKDAARRLREDVWNLLKATGVVSEPVQDGLFG